MFTRKCPESVPFWIWLSESDSKESWTKCDQWKCSFDGLPGTTLNSLRLQVKSVAVINLVCISHLFRHETSNGISASEHGTVKTVNGEDGKPVDVIVATGEFAYTGTDGQVYNLKYVADENGFQPQAAHLPVAPAPQ